MELSVNKNIKPKIYDFFTNKWVYHSLFWLVFLFLLMAIEGTAQGFWFTLSNELINVLIYAIIVYFNVLYLIPNYLSDKKIFTYLGLLILSIIIITPLKVIIFYFKFHDQPELQNFLIAEQNWYFLSNFVVAISSTIVSIISDWGQHQRERQELQTQTMQSELRFLRSQINPHFLFNTLNSLYALTLKKSDKAPEIVIKLSEMMRYMLYECNEKEVFLSKEVNYIRNYLDLEKLRHGKTMEIKFDVVGNISNQKIAPLMFMPFLENSFKHGINNHLEQGFVNIKMNVDGQNIHFNIENSKADALPSQTHKRSGGIGLVNIRRRLNIIYPDHHTLDINDNPRSYEVDLILDLVD